MSRMPYHKGFKISADSAVVTWWYDLTIEEKVKLRSTYEEQRKVHFSGKRHHYYAMPSTENFRISQLTPALIYRIYVFKDKDLNYFK